MKRTLALLLALLFCLPGAAQEVARGRYVQENIELPREQMGVYAMGLDENGRVALVIELQDQALGRATLSAEGIWAVEAMPWWDQLISAFGQVSIFAAALSGADTYLAIYLPREDGGYDYQVLRCGRETITPVDNAEMILDLPGAAALAADGDVVLVKDYNSGAYSYDSHSGHRLAGFPQVSYPQGGAMWMNQGRLYALDQDRQSALVLDAASGEMLDEMAGAPLSDDNAVFCDGQSFYVMSKSGVYRIALGGSMWEQLVDGRLTDLRQASTYARALCVIGEEIYALVGDNGQPKLLRFSYDPEMTTVPTKALTVYTLYPSRLLEQAAGSYQLSNPDTEVHVSVLMSDDAGATRQDVVSALNVELLSGKGPDVLLLDGLPRDAYVEKGVLADLSGTVAPMLESGELFDNLISPFFSGEQIYYAPTRAVLPVAMGQTGFDGWEQLIDAVAGGLTLPPRNRQGYVEMFLPTCFNAWFEGDGSLNEQALTRFLSGIERIYGACGQEDGAYIEQLQYYAQFYQDNARAMGLALVPMNGYEGNSLDLAGLVKGRILMLPTMVQGFSQSMIQLTQLEKLDGGIALLPGQAGRVCAVAGLVGVNARSQEAESAKAFVAAMLSQAVQDTDLYDGAMAVNRRSLEKLVEDEGTDMRGGSTLEDPVTGEQTTLEGKWPGHETREKVYQMISGADAVYAPDEELLTLIREGLAPFCRGEMDSQAAAQAVSARLRAYLAE